MESSISNNVNIEVSYYVEKDTGFVYECQVFETYALVRPATPAFYGMIRKLPRENFDEFFEETLMSPQEVRDYLDNQIVNFRILP